MRHSQQQTHWMILRGATDLTVQRHTEWYCADQPTSPSDVTKYCPCHETWISLILMTYDRPPTSPNFAPATKKSQDWSSSHIKRHLHCAQQQTSPSNVTKYCACHEKWHPKKWKRPAENGWSVIYNGGRFELDPGVIRTRTRHLAPARSPRLLFEILETHFVWNITTLRALALYPKFTRCCPCHDKWHCNITKYCTCHEKCYCACHEKWLWATLLWATLLLSYTTLSDFTLSCYFPELLLYWTVTLLNCYCTEPLLYWAVTWPNRYFTELLLYWTVTLLDCYVTELLFYWTVTWLNRYFTELLLDWAFTWLNCLFTKLLLDWTVTLLSW